jgi:hypothetical protein
MLPSLIRRCAITGSSLASVMDKPPLLPGGLDPLMKALTAAFRRCSSSISWLRRRRRTKSTAPMIPDKATTPTTTPAATAAVLVVEPEGGGVEALVWVTNTVLPDTVTTGAAVVGVAELEADSSDASAKSTSSEIPVL